MVLLLVVAVFWAVDVAAETSHVSVSEESFVCESFSSDNATLFTDEDGYLKIHFSRKSPVLSADVEVEESVADANAFRIVITNNSACNTLFFTYQYLDAEGQIRSQTEKLSLAPRGIRTDYYVYVDSPERVTHISMNFSGISSGSITVHYLDVFSIYNDTRDICGRLDSCVYDREQGKIRISGNMEYEVVTSCRNARLVLYGMSLDSSSFPYGSIPLASVPMSSHFEFSLSDVSEDMSLQAYMVAVVSEGGEPLYTFAPRVPSTVSSRESDDWFYKGVNTDLGVVAARANAELAVVDVDFNKLVSPNVGEGLLYACNGQYFYFNRQYVTMLDNKIQRYYENGMRIALRLHSSAAEVNGLPPIVAVSKQQRLDLFAYTEFLCERYSSSARGVISEIIYGESADRGFTGRFSLGEYTRLYADSLFVVREAAMAAGTHIRIRVPVTDFLETGANLDVRCSPRVFLISLGKVLGERYTGGMTVDILVEGDLLSGSGASGKQLGFEYIKEMSAFLGRLSGEYPMISQRYLYCWIPKNVEDRPLLLASLVHGYYVLAHDKNADGFVMSATHIRDITLVSEMLNVLQYVDSPSGADHVAAALAVLGKQSFGELISGFSEDKIHTVNYRMTANAFDVPIRFFGECYLWDFAGLANDYGWVAGEGCLSAVMEKNEKTGRALAARMLPTADNNYESELIYRYDEKRSFAAVDAVSLDVSVDAEAGRYRVTVQICGENAVAESHVEIDAGQRTMMYLYTAGLFGDEEICCIRIFSVPVSGTTEEYKLSIGSISAYSTELSSQLLERTVEAESVSFEQEETANGPKTVWFFAVAGLVFVSAVILVVIYFRNEEET